MMPFLKQLSRSEMYLAMQYVYHVCSVFTTNHNNCVVLFQLSLYILAERDKFIEIKYLQHFVTIMFTVH